MEMKKRLGMLYLAGLLIIGGCGGPALPVDNVTDMEIETKYVALTFDDGPKQGTTDLLLDGLKERGAEATFFVVGEQALLYPDLIRRMAEEGHQIGNHTWSHVRLEGTKVDAIQEEVGRTEALLQELAGGEGYWLRPPYGQLSPGAETLIKVPMVKWSVDPRDWESRDTKKIVQAVLQSVKPNSIILLHDIYPTSVEAALRLTDALQTQGYWLVTVEELLQLNGITPQVGVLYRTGRGTV